MGGELTAWRRRVRQAQQIARLMAAGQRVWLYQTPAGLALWASPRPRARIIGAAPSALKAAH